MTTLTRSISNDLEFWAELDAIIKISGKKKREVEREWQSYGLTELKRHYAARIPKPTPYSATQARIKELEQKLIDAGEKI
jgi:serine/threonine-protein kinase RIO1